MIAELVLAALLGVALALLARARAKARDLSVRAEEASKPDPVVATIIASAQAEAVRQQRRADEFFSIIEGMEKETDGWRRAYLEGMETAGAAQSMLFRELGRVLNLCNRYSARLRKAGIEVPEAEITPELKAMHDRFEGLRARPPPAKAPGAEAASKVQADFGGPGQGTSDG